MENVCLVEFVALYEKVSNSKKKEIQVQSIPRVNEDDETHEVEEEQRPLKNTYQKYRKGKQRHIIRSVHFNPDTDAEKFYRELIMLYHPCRYEENLKSGCA